MHPDVHLQLHRTRAAELRREAALPRRAPHLRTRLGWAMVDVGLRLATPRRLNPT